MKKLFYLPIIIGLMIAGFASCNKDDDDDPFADLVSGAFDGVITAQVENGNAYNSIVKRVALAQNTWDPNELVSAYANGGFTLTLPQTVDANLLDLMFPPGEFYFEDVFSISDKNVQIVVTSGYFVAVSSSTGDIVTPSGFVNDFCGFFSFYKEDSVGNPRIGTGTYSTAKVEFVYADRDANIAGTGTIGGDDGYPPTIYIYSMSLRKGWNICYISVSYKYVNGEIQEEEVLFTTTPISGLKWWFRSIYDRPHPSPTLNTQGVREGFGRLGR